MKPRLSYVLFGLCVAGACRPDSPRPEQSPSAVAVAARPSAAPPLRDPEPAESTQPSDPPAVLETARPETAPPPLESAQPAPEPAAQAKATRTRRVVVLGDSLSDRRAHGGGYLDALARCPGVFVDNFAQGGFMVNQIRRRFEAEVLPSLSRDHTDLVVWGGVNDLYSDESAGRTVEKVVADLTRIYRAGKARGMRVVALTVAPWGGFKRYYNERRGRATDQLNAWIRQQTQSGLIDVVVDASVVLACGDPERLCARYEQPFHDGLHFGPLGHRELGQRFMAQAFASCGPP